MRWALIIALLFFATPLVAGTLVANRAIPGRTVLQAEDVLLLAKETPGAITSIEDAIGLEARVNLYAGRPIRPGDLVTPAIVERNQIVQMIYSTGGLLIRTEGRALDRAGPGAFIRVMNLASRSIVTGKISPNGTVEVNP